MRQGARQGVRQGARQGQDKERDRGETSETSHLVKLSLPDIVTNYPVFCVEFFVKNKRHGTLEA